MSKAKPGDLQAFVPLYTESVEELWRGRRVTMSSVMKDLEARQSTEQNHVPTTRKNVSTCLKIALSESSSLTNACLLLTLRRLL